MFKAKQLVDNSFGREAKITEKAIKKSKQQMGLLSHSLLTLSFIYAEIASMSCFWRALKLSHHYSFELL